MGLIKVIGASVGGVLKEQWKEFYRCGEMGPETLLVRANKVITKGSQNDDPDDQSVTNGSLMIVADEPAWICVCGQENTGNFCTECGERRPGT